MRVWRICRQAHASGAFSGEGARLYGGRWNSEGVKVVYTSTSLALAEIENFVHLEPSLQADDLVLGEAEIPDDLAVEHLSLKALPRKWREHGNESLKVFGDRWIRAGSTIALHVPSATIPGEWNVLLNPEHSHVGKINGGKP